jgi:hypothetical protein
MIITKDDAQSLVEVGYVVLQGHVTSYAEQAQAALCDVLSRFGSELSSLCFEHEKRPDGKYEPDDGFIDWVDTKNQLRKDVKRIFHYRPDLYEKIYRTNIGRKFRMGLDGLLQSCDALFGYHRSIALQIGEQIDALRIMPESVSLALTKALKNPALTSRSVARLLRYPPYTGTEKGKVHLDRSFLTLYAGDRGGWLYRLDREGNEIRISPARGELLVFWGCKAARFGKRNGVNLTPIAHGSRSVPDEPREAVVSFWHVNEVLWDADPVR